MSWSVQLVGKKQAVKANLDKACAGYTEGTQSRKEFEAAKEHLQGLLDQVDDKQAVQLDASGHAQFDATGAMVQGSVGVNIKVLYGFCE